MTQEQRRLVLGCAAPLVLAIATFGQAGDISGERIRAHVKFLSSDLLEGRGVGTRGEKLATDYIASQFAVIGAKPAGDQGTYFQHVPMIGVTTEPSASLSVVSGSKNVS